MWRPSEPTIEGYEELKQVINKLEKLPQTMVTKSARKGANIVLREARQNAPVEIGNLKRGIILKPEKTRTKGKKVYQVTMDRRFNKFFQKPIKNPGKYGGKNPKGYYPASQEYGFFTAGGRYVPGYNYLRGSNETKKTEAEQIIVKTMLTEVDKII